MENAEESRRRYERERSQRRRNEDPEGTREVAKKWAKDNPTKRALTVRKWWLQRMYSMTLDAYDALLLQQGGGCAICGKPQAGQKNLTVDHDHGCCPGATSCGKCIRGILCRMCNVALGHFGDDLDGIQRVVKYLENPPAWN